jgi:hypothetical protein
MPKSMSQDIFWLHLRTFLAIFLAVLGIGLMFGRSSDPGLLPGAFFVALGVHYLLVLSLALRRA